MIRFVYKRIKNFTIQFSVQENPTPGSFGDYILLKKDLTKRSESKILEKIREKDPKRYEQMIFNISFLKKMRKKHKRLHCVYCNKKNLKIYEFHEHAKRSNMATADHYLPRSLYPELALDETNLRVCCDSCNNKKGQELWYEKFPYKQLKNKKHVFNKKSKI